MKGRRNRKEDHERVQQALGNALLFKMIRINTDFKGIHRHIEECFEESLRRGDKGEPWQFVLPLANPPDSVHFSSEEMGMLLGLKNDDVFNLVASMDVIHNSLIDVVRVLNSKREELAERLPVAAVNGAVVSSDLSRQEVLDLQPHIIVVNSLIENIRARAKKDFEESNEALKRVHNVLRDNLGLAHKLEFPDESGGSDDA